MMPRFSLSLLALLFSIILPWWLNIFVWLFLIFFFSWYYEVGLAVFIYELIYGSGYFWLTIIVILSVPVIEWLKKRLYAFS